MTAKPWIVYSRVSTTGQADEGVSLDVQTAACSDLRRILGHPGAEVITDPGFSAKNLDRPGIQRVLRMVADAAIGGVIVYKLDRLTRSVEDLYRLMRTFDQAGVALVAVRDMIDTSTSNGRMMVGFMGVIAQWARENIADLVTAGMRHRKAQGGFIGGTAPAGLAVIGEAGKRELVVDEDRGPKVEKCWRLILEGNSLRDVAEYLTAQGIATRSKSWTAGGAQQLLRNERYIGKLIDRATFDQVTATLTGRLAPGKAISGKREIFASQTHSQRVWPLSGIARCGQCGSALVGVHAHNGQGTAYPYLRCGGRVRSGRSFCAAKDLPAEPWEEAVMRLLADAVTAQGSLLPAVAALQAQATAEADPLRATLTATTLERDAATQRVRNLAEVAATGAQVARGLAVPIAEAQTVVEALDAKIAGIEGRLAGMLLTAEHASDMVAALRSLLDGIEDLDPEAQSKILHAALATATLHPPTEPNGAGQVDLAINLPHSEFVELSTVVVHSKQPTNITASVSNNLKVKSLREWRADRA